MRRGLCDLAIPRLALTMYVLALDTTTREGSVALVDQFEVIGERRGDGRRGHAERLPDELTGLAAAHGVPLSAISLFAVASGPGSFTGLRIGIATIQGLAIALGRRIAAVSALEALAHTVVEAERAEPGSVVGAWVDARRGDVFSALYRVSDAAAYSSERLNEIEGPMVGEPAAALRRWRDHIDGRPLRLAGDGAILYADTIDRAAQADWRVIAPLPILAGTIGRMALARGQTIDPAAVQPLYVRRPDAEIDRDKRAAGATPRAPHSTQRTDSA